MAYSQYPAGGRALALGPAPNPSLLGSAGQQMNERDNRVRVKSRKRFTQRGPSGKEEHGVRWTTPPSSSQIHLLGLDLVPSFKYSVRGIELSSPGLSLVLSFLNASAVFPSRWSDKSSVLHEVSF